MRVNATEMDNEMMIVDRSGIWSRSVRGGSCGIVQGLKIGERSNG